MICVSINDLSHEKCIQEISKFEMAEIRMDLNEYSINEVEAIFKSHSNLIATFRKTKGDQRDRELYLKNAIVFGAKYVDLDLNTDSKLFKKIIPFANNNDSKIIISSHNFIKTPSMVELKKIKKECLKAGADIVKIATLINKTKDIQNILNLYDNKNMLISIGMGDLGKMTRIAALSLGAPFTYASKDKKNCTAPGQIEMKSLQAILSLIDG